MCDLLTVPDSAQATRPPSLSTPLYNQHHRWKVKDNPRCTTLSNKCGRSQARASCTRRPTRESLTSLQSNGWFPCLKGSEPCSYPNPPTVQLFLPASSTYSGCLAWYPSQRIIHMNQLMDDLPLGSQFRSRVHLKMPRLMPTLRGSLTFAGHASARYSRFSTHCRPRFPLSLLVGLIKIAHGPVLNSSSAADRRLICSYNSISIERYETIRNPLVGRSLSSRSMSL